MSLSSLSSAQLHRLIELVKEKEALQAKLAQVERSLAGLESGKVAKDEAPAKQRGQRRRGGLKDALLTKLQAAGKDGLTVKELAASVNAKPTSVSTWFYTTGKTIKGIKKVGRTRFAYIAG
jgi:hypothetical protein